jgi:hypothetical protein
VGIDSLLAPPIGSAGGANGTMSVQLKNRDDAGVPGLPVTITAADGSYGATKVTNALGCALFTYIPADAYDVKVNVSGYVDPDGRQAVVKSNVGVAAGDLTSLELLYDRKATLGTTFDTRYWDPVTADWKTVPSRARALTLANAGMTVGARTFTAAATSPAALGIDAIDLFPFGDGYAVFSGRCAEQNPSLYDATWAATGAFLKLDPGQTASMTIRQPALPVRVANGKNGGPTFPTQPKWVGDANVQAKLVGLAATSTCSAAPDTVPGIAQDATNGLQTYPVNQAYSGTLAAQNHKSGLLGLVTRKAPGTNGETWAAGYFDPGLPWGTWQVCADSGGRRNFITVQNVNPDGVSTPPLTLDLAATGSQLGTCGGAAWPAPVLPGVTP